MQQPKRELTFRDLVLLVLGSIIGSGIFFVPGGMLAEANLSAWTTVLAWLAGAAIAMSGALMFAQLGAAFPQAGGQVAFLHKGLGRLPAFLFSWTGFTVVQSGTIAAIAVAMAQAVDGVWDLPGDSTPWRGLELPGWGVAFLAVGIIALLTLVNLRGVRDGAAVNNAAAFAKTFGLLLLVVVVFALGKGSGNLTGGAPGLGAAGFAGFGGALLLCLFAYDGFAQATFVSAEAKDPARTVPRAIVVGVLAVAAVYILATLAYLHAIPVQEVAPAVLQGERSIAQDAARSVGGEGFALLIALAVVVSTFGATNAYILASPRIYAALAQARDFPRAFGRLTRTGTPGYGLWYQAVWAGLLTMTGGYLTLADLAVFGLYTFYLLTAIAYFVLRVRHPEAFGSFGGRLRPVAPAMFAAASAAVLLLYAWNDVPAMARIRDVSDVVANTTLFGLLLIGSGLVAYAGLRRPLAGARAE